MNAPTCPRPQQGMPATEPSKSDLPRIFRGQRSCLGQRTLPIALVGLMTLTIGGCAMPALPDMSGMDLLSPGFLKQGGTAPQYHHADGSRAQALGTGDSMSMETYQRIKQAKQENSVVLQVSGDEAPIRVLPLPTEGKSVFVSELLTQTGLLKKFGSVQATLFRPSVDSIAGIRMDVRLDEDGKIDPTTDYALRPGDRVYVNKRASTGSVQSLVDLALRR